MNQQEHENSPSAATLKGTLKETSRALLETLVNTVKEFSQAAGSYHAWKSSRHSKNSIKKSREAQQQCKEIIQDLEKPHDS